ncbi:hypothetical protein T11_2520 [Trichinella zimbabwensis]|uniref:Uncharacterized protein n=1 Tax=Trichinella zimbabwensis TaxID=268475 RepID=A0A0V1GVA3_9BILA|nr:hypothetical protein T11_2520 [Trichinella zimbabwensis]
MTATAEMRVESVESCSIDEACLIGTFIRECRSFPRVLSLSSGFLNQKSSPAANSHITSHGITIFYCNAVPNAWMQDRRSMAVYHT